MNGRRGNGEGSIIKRSDGRWQGRITLENGKRRSFYGKTRQEVARQLTEALRDQARGILAEGGRQTVAQYLTNWLVVIKPTIRLGTWQRYEQYVRLHTIPTLGNTSLVKLSGQQLQTLYANRLEAGMSATSVHHLHMMLHHALDNALRLDLVQRNVCDLVDPPRMRRHLALALTPQQARSLLDAAKGDPLQALFVVALNTGMRLGELLALRWQFVDLDGGSLQVRATLRRAPGGFVFAEPKTEHSRRQVMLTPQAVEALRQQYIRQVEHKSALGAAWEDSDLVFPNSIGKPLEFGNVLRRNYWPLLKRANLPRIRFHDLRHTAATLLLRAGVHPKIVSEMLGHSAISITLDTYSHVLPDMQREAVDALQRILYG